MEHFALYIPSIIIIAIAVFYIWRYARIALKYNFAHSNKSLVLLPTKDFKQTWEPFLNMYFPYFKNLNETGREQFIKRLIRVLKDIDIVGKENLEVNDEMRILLAATLAQITFGLKRYGLPGYKMIHVYPSKFHIRNQREPVIAATYKKNVISLSWMHFEKGILHEQDGNNLGVKELSYALERTVRNGELFDLHFASYLDIWYDLVKKQPTEIQQAFYDFIGTEPGEDTFLLANTVVLFFEKPFEFKRDFPDIYAHLCVLLHQNPLNITENYTYTKNWFKAHTLKHELPDSVIPTFHHNIWHWSYNVFIINLCISPLVIYYYLLPNHFINLFEITIAIIGLSLVTIPIANYYNNRHKLFSNAFKAFSFNLFGGSPIAIIILMLINDLIPIQANRLEEHQIKEVTALTYHSNRGGSRISDYEFTFVDSFLLDYPYARRINPKCVDHTTGIEHGKIAFTYRRGILGFNYIKNKQVIYNPDYIY
ncbi:MAG: hypothetical protein EAY81_03485 [Bacteroidetes bacterium]|nr:MAG: hypothetical protein EAY81_03485 [Bacteroidota bacterium]